MRIVIDMQGAQTGSRFRGIGRYTVSLVITLLRNHRNHEYFLVLNGLFKDTIEPLRAEFNGLIAQINIRVWEAQGPVSEILDDNLLRQKTAELLRESFIENLCPDIVLITTIFEGYGDDFIASIGKFDSATPVVLIFYDLIPYLYPETYLADKRVARWYENKLEQCKRADLLLSISESSMIEAIEHLKIPSDKIINISTASDDRFHIEQLSLVEKEELLERFEITKPYLMYLSATDWRKNHKRLIEAYSKLSNTIRASHQLCFVGGLSFEHEKEFKRYAKLCGLMKNEVVITGYVTDEEINRLYNLCKAFVFPSWHEGFGLPVLEAMQCGRAVICANTSSLPEVIGLPEAMFDPFNVEAISQKVERVLTDDFYRRNLEEHSLHQANKFSWDKTARIAIDAIESRYNPANISKQIEKKPANKERTSRLINMIATLTSTYDDQDLLGTAVAIAQNLREISPSQLFVDISELIRHDSKTGIQRVVRNILHHWLSNPPQGMSVAPIYAAVDHGYKYARAFVNEFMGKVIQTDTDDYIEFGPGDVFIGLDLVHPDTITKHLGFYQILRNHGVLVKFILYDLLPLQLPHYTNIGVPEGFSRWLDIVSCSDGLICISKAVADDLASFMGQQNREGLRPCRIDWFHLGADIENSKSGIVLPDESFSVVDQLCRRKSFLMVGTLEPRKGYVQVIDAFEQLWQFDVDANLVIVGKQGWKCDDLVIRLRAHPEMNKRLFWLEGISDDYLEKVYAVSNCLVAASYGEGFGLPLIEAAQHKLPIIARDIPVFREVAGEYAYYFDTSKPEELAQVIRIWLALYDNNQHPKSDDMPWLTWNESALILCEKIFGAV